MSREGTAWVQSTAQKARSSNVRSSKTTKTKIRKQAVRHFFVAPIIDSDVHLPYDVIKLDNGGQVKVRWNKVTFSIRSFLHKKHMFLTQTFLTIANMQVVFFHDV